MTTRKELAEEYSNGLMEIEDIKIRLKGIEEAAADAKFNVKALKRVAREMCMEPAKLAKALDDEAQLDLFRNDVGLLKRKGLALKEAA